MKCKDEIIRRLEAHYPDARPGLNYDSAFQLLIATMLSAQTTDRQVNAVTGTLFERHPNAASFLALSQSELEDIIKSCGFFRTKTKNILETCRILMQKYGGKVPSAMEELTELPGVGRKTANVVLSNAFGISAIAVDTHVFRVANRLGLVNAKNVRDAEEQLKRAIPEEKWSQAHLWLILHGRKVCSARKPDCCGCFLEDVCRYAEELRQSCL